MLLTLILFAVGLFILIKGADLLVSGASALALRLNIKPIVVGLTVVAFGTSSPELVVSATSILSNNTGIALGNIIGSNIANILLVLGISALICTLHVSRNTTLKEIPMSLLGVIAVIVLGMQEIIDIGGGFQLSSVIFDNNLEGFISRADGFILLLFFSIFVYYTITIAKGVTDGSSEIEKKPLKTSLIFIILGLFGLTLGGKLTVDGAIFIARLFGVSDNFIGLTLVAVGTSLPELVTSIVAALRRNVDILIGNVIGSNIFNILFVLGIVSVIKPIPLFTENVFDIVVLFFTTIILFILLFTYRKHRISKQEGIILIILYILYIVFIFIRE